jgi:hypothetical protein
VRIPLQSDVSPFERAIFFRFEPPFFLGETGERLFKDQERFFGFNTQHFVSQRQVRTDRGQNLFFDRQIPFGKPVARRAGKMKRFFYEAEPLFDTLVSILEEFFETGFFLEQRKALVPVLLIREQTPIGVLGGGFEPHEVIEPCETILVGLLLTVQNLVPLLDSCS